MCECENEWQWHRESEKNEWKWGEEGVGGRGGFSREEGTKMRENKKREGLS